MPSLGHIPYWRRLTTQQHSKSRVVVGPQRPACLVSLAVGSRQVVVGSIMAIYGGWHCSAGERADFKG